MLEPISINIESLNIVSLLPMLITILGALLITCIDLATKSLSKSFYAALSVLFVLLSLGATLGFSGNVRGFFDLMLIDGISVLSQAIILTTSALFIPLALSNLRFQESTMAEFYSLFLFMIAGFQFMVATDNLILIFIGLETASLALYTIIAMHNRLKAIEAALKYFSMGALAAGFFVMGSLIFYALTGSVEIHQISQTLGQRGFEPMAGVLAGSVFILAALGFKLSLVPFHAWTPDVYEGSSGSLAGYMSVVPKIAGFIVAIRFFEMLIGSGVVWVENILYIVTVVTMTFGNVTALVQEDVKRMLAYSSIAHAGFVLSAILIGTTESNAALFLYWILFMFTNLGAFTMLWSSRHRKNLWDDRYQHPFAKFSGMIKVKPTYAIVMGVFMLALAGVPPFSVFWGKLYLISTAINSGFIYLAIIMVFNSAIAIYYYSKLVVYMFLKDPASSEASVYDSNSSMPLKVVAGISFVATVFAVLAVEPLLQTILSYVSSSGF